MKRKSRILLLDDDVFHRGLLAEGLEDYYDFEVRKVDSLAAAKEKIGEFQPDLLLLDVVAGDDRLEVIEWVKQLRAAPRPVITPVLFVTAYYKDMKERVSGLENTAILPKPFKFEEVTQEIRKLLGRGR
ncbi:MAG TPA: response regulator [Thermoanaerobaculia bacterium]|nr:response regulator [Thermoanaerobaculia bacterium]